MYCAHGENGLDTPKVSLEYQWNKDFTQNLRLYIESQCLNTRGLVSQTSRPPPKVTGLVVKAGFLVASCHIAPRGGSEEALSIPPAPPSEIFIRQYLARPFLCESGPFFLPIIA